MNAINELTCIFVFVFLICFVSGVVSTMAGSVSGYGDGVGTSARFYNPYGVSVDSSGTVYVGDYGNHRIRKISSSGNSL